MRYCFPLFLLFCSYAAAQPSALELKQDDQAGALTVHQGDRELLAYQHGEQFALPHIWPLRSPSGKLLTDQRPDPFPHHRSLWIAERVKVGEEIDVDFYHCWKNYREKDNPESGFKHFLLHQRIDAVETDGRSAAFTARLQWIVNDSTPVIDEVRTHRVAALDDGEYLLELQWELRASQGRDDVVIASDWVHYAWPYLRIHPQFSGERGGRITSDAGAHGQKETSEKYAKWIDYSNTVDGKTEGVAVFPFHTDKPFKWLTREYGTFGPRRPDEQSGKRLPLKPRQPLTGRVGILVHTGDATTGSVAERYQQYIKGNL